MRVGVTVHAELMPSRLGPDVLNRSDRTFEPAAYRDADSLEEKVDNLTGELLVDSLSVGNVRKCSACDQ